MFVGCSVSDMRAYVIGVTIGAASYLLIEQIVLAIWACT